MRYYPALFCVHTFPKLYLFEFYRENIRDLHTNMRFLSSCWRIYKSKIYFCKDFVMVTIANLPSHQALPFVLPSVYKKVGIYFCEISHTVAITNIPLTACSLFCLAEYLQKSRRLFLQNFAHNIDAITNLRFKKVEISQNFKHVDHLEFAS